MNDTTDGDKLTIRWEHVRGDLSGAGFNLVAAVTPQLLPKTLAAQLGEDQDTTAVVVAAGGRDLWQTMNDAGALSLTEPFDEFTIARVTEIFDARLPGVQYEFAYPGTGAAPLIGLGEYLGWSSPSFLGLGINSEFGLWFAYRALLRVHAALPHSPPKSAPELCETCVARDCVAACPAGAVTQVGNFSIESCADFRVGANSQCAASCLARLACPVGKAHQYTEPQFSHHQGRSLSGLKRWLNKR